MFVYNDTEEVSVVSVFYWLIVYFENWWGDLALGGVECYGFSFCCIKGKFVCAEPFEDFC